MLKKLEQKIRHKLFMARLKQFLKKQKRLQKKCERCSDTMRAVCIPQPEYCLGPYDC